MIFVVPGEVLGGAERMALERALYLRDSEGAMVGVLALDDRPGAGRLLAARHRIAWSCIRIPWRSRRVENAASLARFAVAARRLRPDILVGVTNLPNAVAGLTWRTSGASTFVWTQCDVNGTTRINRALFSRALRASPLVVTQARHGRDWLVGTLGADPGRLHVFYDRMSNEPPAAGRREWRDRLGIREGAFVATMLAHFHAGKDHATVVRAWRLVVDRLSQTTSNPTLLLAGRDAANLNAVKALAFDLDLGGHVRFIGEVDDVPGLLGASDLGLFSSHLELLPRGVTEPMGIGLPVVGTDIPGIREAVGEPGRPFLAPPGDSVCFADSILRLWVDPDLRETVGRANAELIRGRHSVASSSRAYAAMLAAALGGARS